MTRILHGEPLTNEEREQINVSKAYFQRARDSFRLKRMAEEKLQEAIASAESISIDYSGMPSGKGKASKQQLILENVEERKVRLAAEVDEWNRICNAADDVIRNLPPDEQEVLSYYYESFINMEEIARKKFYSRGQCYRIYRSGLIRSYQFIPYDFLLEYLATHRDTK